MPTEFSLDTIEQKAGDHGPDAAISARVTDSNGDPVTTGSVTLRVATFDGPWDVPVTVLHTEPMAHQSDGVWSWEPDEGDLQVGVWRLEAFVGDTSLPPDGYGRLLVRPALVAPGG